MWKNILSGALLLASLSCQAADQRADRVEQGLRPAIAAQGQAPVRWNIADRLKFYHVPGVSVALIDGGKVVWTRGWGVKAEGGGAVDAETLFQAASLSKHVAAMVALRLVDQGKLSLDEDVNARLRSWKVPENEFTKVEKVTLRRLLNHSAGLTVHGFPGYAATAAVPTVPQLLDGKPPANTAAVRVDVVPGTLYRYSGGGYEVAQLLMTDVTGKPFPELARELVLKPLGMTRSGFEQPLPKDREGNAAAGHRGDGKLLPGRWHTYPEMTAAGLWTTPSDLAKVILELQTAGRILKPATQKTMLTKLLGDYGLGVGLQSTGGHPSFSHGGSNEGYRCQMFGYLDSGQGAVVMTNGDNGSPLTSEILRSIAAEYGWADFRQTERKVATVTPAALESYAGIYAAAGQPEITMTLENGKLYATLRGNKVGLLPESETVFFSLEPGVPDLRFSRGANGAIDLSAGNNTWKKR